MRILAVASWWPAPADNGIKQRIYQLLRVIGGKHELHLAALSQGVLPVGAEATLQPFCTSAVAVPERKANPDYGMVIASLWRNEPASVRTTWNDAFARLVVSRAVQLQPDLILAFELSAAPYARLAPAPLRLLDDLEMAVIYDAYRAAHGPRRLRMWLTWAKHTAYVRRSLADFAACTVVSTRELGLTRRLAPKAMPIEVIANGADVSGSQGSWGSPEPDTLIYPGSLSFDANFDAVSFFLETIWPTVRTARPNVVLRISGRDDPQRRGALSSVAGVAFTGLLPDVRPLIARSWAEVVPLRKGSGTRLKILEALALGTPVITTTKGFEGLNLEPGRDLLVADTPARFADETIRLLSDPELRERLAQTGRRTVATSYDWNYIGARLCQLIEELGARKGRNYDFKAA